MPDEEIFDEPLEDKLPPVPDEPAIFPSKNNRHEEACFPSNDYGMPLALLEVPVRERPYLWKDGEYRDHKIAYVKVQTPEHKYLFSQKRNRAFYVHDKEGNLGLVPFPNSTIVWPWEDAAWKQDLAPENQGKTRRDLKPSERK
jgi:hypothetical protein